MSEAAGSKGRDEPLSVGAVRYDFNDDINIGATSQYAWEFMNTLYTEANAVFSLRSSRVCGYVHAQPLSIRTMMLPVPATLMTYALS
jgi:hypothetical protein